MKKAIRKLKKNSDWLTLFNAYKRELEGVDMDLNELVENIPIETWHNIFDKALIILKQVKVEKTDIKKYLLQNATNCGHIYAFLFLGMMTNKLPLSKFKREMNNVIADVLQEAQSQFTGAKRLVMRGERICEALVHRWTKVHVTPSNVLQV